ELVQRDPNRALLSRIVSKIPELSSFYPELVQRDPNQVLFSQDWFKET
ncbi:14488_t:CDS:1, partial [Dentiscutata heterogama]